MTCPNGSGRGRRSVNATACGRVMAPGNSCSSRSGPRPTRRVRSTGTSRWTPPSCTHINMWPALAPIRLRNSPQGGRKGGTPGRDTVAKLRRPPGGGGAGGEGLGRSRGGFTSKLHLSGDGRCRPLSLIVTPGQRADCTQFIAVLEKIRVPRRGAGRPRVKPGSLAAGKAYGNGPVRKHLRRWDIRHTIPEKSDSQAARPRKGSRGGRPPGFDKDRRKKRNTVERRSTA